MDLSGTVQKLEERPVAQGGFSDIYLGLLTRSPQAAKLQVAIKVIVPHRSSEETNRRLQRRLSREISMWKDLDHPGVIKLYGISSDFGKFPALISPWYSNGNAREYLKAHPNTNRLNLLRGAIAAIDYLHGLHPAVVHGDIKAVNVFIKDDGEACLGDFGLSRFIQQVSTGFTTTVFSGTPRWMAPELLFTSNGDLAPVTKEGDVYAFGCLALEITTDEWPWHAIQNNHEVMLKVYEGRLSPRPESELAARELSDELWALIETCWSYKPSGRPQAHSAHSALLSIIEAKTPVSSNGGEDSGELFSLEVTGAASPLPGDSVTDTILALDITRTQLLSAQADLLRSRLPPQPSEDTPGGSNSGEITNSKDTYIADSIAKIHEDVFQLYHHKILPDVRRNVVPDIQRIMRQLRF